MNYQLFAQILVVKNVVKIINVKYANSVISYIKENAILFVLKII